MSDYLGKDMRKVKKDGGVGEEDESKALDKIVPLDEADISLMRNYGSGPYAKRIKAVEEKIQGTLKNIHALMGVKVSDEFPVFCFALKLTAFYFYFSLLPLLPRTRTPDWPSTASGTWWRTSRC